MYAGIGAGAVALVLGVALFLYFRKRSSKSHNQTETTKADAPGPLPPMQLVQQNQYLQPQPPPPPQQHLYAQQPVISRPPHQTFDQHMHQYTQPIQVSTSGYYLNPTPVATNPQQQHQQGQTMTFHHPTISEKTTPIATAAKAETYNPHPMPVLMPVQSTSYAIASPIATVLQTPVTFSPALAAESSIKNPAVSTHGPQGLVVSKNPQFVSGGMGTMNVPHPVNNPQQYFESTYRQ